MEFTASETNTYRMFGLSTGDSDQNYTDIDFAIYAVADATLQVYEGGVLMGNFGPYAAGDRLRVAVEGGVVKYKRNGAVIYTSTRVPVYPLLADASLYSIGATITNAVISGNLQSSGFNNPPIPRDGLSSVSYDGTSNRITSAGYSYDAAGNQISVVHADSSVQKYQYDAANRMVKVRNANNLVLATYTYGATNQRLIAQAGDEQSSYRTYYAWGGDAVLAEYSENPSQPTSPQWTKSYVYLGARLLATLTPTGTSSELIQYHHPDRLGTRLVTNAQDTNSFEQVTLPFGTALDAESSGATNRRFTSYDRSSITGLDYAINRHYDAQQGRFTQVDPLGMSAVSFDEPQTLNLYAYCANDPINSIDPDGLFWGKLWRGIKKVLSNKWVQLALIVAITVLTAGSSTPLIITNYSFVAATGAVTTSIGLTTAGWAAAALSSALSIGLGFQGDCKKTGGIYDAPCVVEGVWDKVKRIGKTVLDALGNFSAGVADDFTFGFTTWYDRWMGRDRGTDENSTSYKAGGVFSFAVSIIIPGPGKFKALKVAEEGALRGFVKHGIDQAITRGVKPQHILDALRNPLKINPIRFDSLGRPSRRIIGSLAEVVVNPATGKVVSVNPTSTRKALRLQRK